MYTIVLIGAGQLGSRHLQALANINLPVHLQVVDPFKKSLRIAEQRFLEIPDNEKVCSTLFATSIENISPDIDLCVVATNADVRLKVLKNVVKKKKIKNLILEKVLFQKIEDFEEASNIIISHKIKTWVNCPRRMVPFYANLVEHFSQKKISMQVSGGNWGLGCSAIHFIDLVSFLNKIIKYEPIVDGLDEFLVESHRFDCKEFTGLFKGQFENGSTFSLESVKDSHDPIEIVIETDTLKIVINESEGKAVLKQKKYDWKEEHIQFRIPFQSELTHLVAQDILEKGSCGLTSFDESCALHLPMIKAFNEFISKVEKRNCFICPIT